MIARLVFVARPALIDRLVSIDRPVLIGLPLSGRLLSS
jgi:hypothetical protein